MKRITGFLLVCLCVGHALIGCDDSTTTPAKPAHLSGTIFVLPDSTPVSAKVVLINGRDYTIVSGPARTDRSGNYILNYLPAGSFYLFVFTDANLALEPTSLWVSLSAGDSLERDVGLIRSELWQGGGTRFAGRVTDALTGRPVSGAYVSTYFGTIWHSYVGISLPNECVTGTDGRYLVTATRLISGPGQVVGLLPVAVSAEGYDAFVSDVFDAPASSDTVLTLDVELTRGGPKGAIHGRITRDGTPVAGVPVGLDYQIHPDSIDVPAVSRQDRREPDRVPMLGKSTRSDSRGEFLITGLTTGYYRLDAAYLPGDGYVGTQREGCVVTAGNTTDVGDVEVLRAFRPVAPPSGAVIDDTTPTLEWEVVPGASYEINLAKGHLFTVTVAVGDTTQYTVPEFWLSPGDRVRWYVRAYDGGEIVSEFEWYPSFSIVVSQTP